ncbi:RluA family pseudouridine synthase [Bacillus solimangrovi]|uniref:Pseudouridine synthase n=1 Tax=Bacillus solimangrovi TaxID=1305675 RepID=A0A1E5LB08_9BACI|nr:RluA family pseudouridine synthase [Bacillus solimangrovi]OEH91189.1 pseudouridine synthase [Bacillus solimangrovi]
MEKMQWSVELEHQGTRIDKWVADQNQEWSRSQVQQWIKESHLLVNGSAVKVNQKVKQGDEITLTIPEPEPLDVEPEKMELEIYFEDEDVLVVNKPSGMVVHPAPGHLSGTLVNGLMAHCNDLSGINGVMRPGIVHRIDKDTSGLLMVAKNDVAHESLVQQLVDKTVLRKYRALVHGVIPHEKGTIEAPLGRDPKDRQKMAVVDQGKEAVTHFQVLERFKNHTYVECQLETGRTHQIRVHMRYIGFPLVGDPKYGPRKTIDVDGQALHAETLGFEHPQTKEFVSFQAPLPERFAQILDNFRKNS